MCGLAGLARCPGSATSEELAAMRVITHELMKRMEPRGRHATGIAVVGQPSFLFKRAMTFSQLATTPVWEQQVLTQINEHTAIVLGHTRQATLPNGHVDEAAHPFVHGQTVGAHNGMISNWRELAEKEDDGKSWIVDSQAAISLLNKHADPQKALELLHGWFALSWVKHGKLHLFRSSGSDFSAAYAPQLRTLFWASTMPVLREVLGGVAGLKNVEYWELAVDMLYRYDPRKFGVKGTSVRKRPLKLKPQARRGGRERTFAFGGGWDWETARETRNSMEKRGPVSGRSYSLKEMDEALIALTRRLGTVEAEVDFLRRVARENGLLDRVLDDSDLCAVCKKSVGDDENEVVEMPDGEKAHTTCLVG